MTKYCTVCSVRSAAVRRRCAGDAARAGSAGRDRASSDWARCRCSTSRMWAAVRWSAGGGPFGFSSGPLPLPLPTSPTATPTQSCSPTTTRTSAGDAAFPKNATLCSCPMPVHRPHAHSGADAAAADDSSRATRAGRRTRTQRESSSTHR